MKNSAPAAELRRQAEARTRGAPWWRWGPYLSERQWGTVREDYSPGGSAWDYFPHDHARSRAYRWGEDGLLGISDNHGRLCFALALWNEADPILKERLFGLTGPEGNHGEDVKEAYFYVDSTPTHSYMRALYKYPQQAFPYANLVAENRKRGRDQPEYEVVDTGIFGEDRCFDVQVEYAKAGPTDFIIRISATNRGPDPAPLRVLPTLWFRNTWSWERDDPDPGGLRAAERPVLRQVAPGLAHAEHRVLGDYWLACDRTPELLEQAAATSENAANSAGRIAFPLTQGGLPGAARLSMPRPITVWSPFARHLLVATRGHSRLLLALPGSRRKCSPEKTAKTDLLSASKR